MANAESPIDLTHHLKGIDLPASKKGLVEHARATKSPAMVIERLQAMPERQYATMADLMKGFKASE